MLVTQCKLKVVDGLQFWLGTNRWSPYLHLFCLWLIPVSPDRPNLTDAIFGGPFNLKFGHQTDIT